MALRLLISLCGTLIVAIAYLLHKTPYVFPIVGGRKIDQLEANLDALRISLTPEHMKYLESVLPFDPGFPNWMIVSTNLILPKLMPASSVLSPYILCLDFT